MCLLKCLGGSLISYTLQPFSQMQGRIGEPKNRCEGIRAVAPLNEVSRRPMPSSNISNSNFLVACSQTPSLGNSNLFVLLLKKSVLFLNLKFQYTSVNNTRKVTLFLRAQKLAVRQLYAVEKPSLQTSLWLCSIKQHHLIEFEILIHQKLFSLSKNVLGCQICSTILYLSYYNNTKQNCLTCAHEGTSRRGKPKEPVKGKEVSILLQ